jgi:hypothetical protein
MSEENAKAAPITLYGRLLDEKAMVRESTERLEDYMAKGIYQHLPFLDKVLCCAQLSTMRFYLWTLHRRMKRL